MTSLPDIKRGDTFSIGCKFRNSDNNLQDLTDFTIRSQVRTKVNRDLVSELPVVVSNQTTNPGEFAIITSTSDWPVGLMLLDIEFITGNVKVSSETVSLQVVQDITYD